jgi:hypothetical protein
MRPPPLLPLLLLFFGHLALAQAPAAQPNPVCARESSFERTRTEFPSADPKCVDAAKLADDCCRQPNQEKCGYRESNFGNQRLAAEGDQGAYAAGLRQARDLTVSANRNRVFASICRVQRVKADRACYEAESATHARANTVVGRVIHRTPNTHTREFRARMIREADQYRACHSNQATQNEQELQRHF